MSVAAPRIGAALADTAALVEELASAPVLVHGSLREESRDLDLLARPEQEAELVRGLTDAGFVRRGLELARFRDKTVELVDLVPSSDWALPDAELDALFSESIPIEPYRQLVRPAPHHVLLALARRIVEGSGVLDEQRRGYIERALAEDENAWSEARAHADAWGGPAALQLLERAWSTGAPLRLTERAAAMVDRQRRRGVDPAHAHVWTWRHLLRRPRLGSVIALSGIDGSGKSTHSAILRESLTTLGYDTTYEWNKLATNAWLWRLRPLAARAVFLLTPSRRRPADVAPPRIDQEAAPWGETAPPDAATVLREQSAVLSHAWVTLIAAANTVAHLRAVWKHVLRGRVVICDRYTLDSVVHMGMRFGDERSWEHERRLVRTFSPKPLRAYFLDLSPEVAHARKLEDELEWLQELARRYRAEYEGAGAIRVDAEQPLDVMAAELARDAWLALGD